MWSIIIIGLIDLVFLMAVVCAENIDTYINVCYPRVLRVLAFVIPKRYKYFSVLVFAVTIFYEINIIAGIIGTVIGRDELTGIAISLGEAFPGALVLGYLLDYLFYRLINFRKVKKVKSPELINDSLLIAVNGKVIEQMKYIKSECSKELVVILPWLHNVSYEGNMVFMADSADDDKYNFMLYNQLVNELSEESKSVLQIKYTQDCRLYTVDTFIQELADVICDDFSGQKLSIISHGPQAGVEAVLFATQYKVDSITLLCGGLGVGEYYVHCINQIIDENRLSLPWDNKLLRQQENAIKNIRTHLQCHNCALIKTSSTFETYCHGYCGKNITQYFGSLLEYSTEQIMEMINNMKCTVSIIWPEYSIGPWKQHYNDWSNIPNADVQIIENCYETFRKPGIKTQRPYSHIFIVR